MDLLHQGAVFLDRVRHESLSREVVYARGEEEVALQATVGATSALESDDLGMVTRFRSRDYILRLADLNLPTTGQITPKTGDLIREEIEGAVCVYEVRPTDGAIYKHLNTLRGTIRVHTKFLRIEP